MIDVRSKCYEWEKETYGDAVKKLSFRPTVST